VGAYPGVFMTWVKCRERVNVPESKGLDLISQSRRTCCRQLLVSWLVNRFSHLTVGNGNCLGRRTFCQLRQVKNNVFNSTSDCVRENMYINSKT